jgi:hypothetical protein
MRFAAAFAGVCLLTSVSLSAQDPQATAAWDWAASANVFFGYNYQQREFRDFSEWESQNWFMLGAERRTRRDRARLQAMFSLEAFTLEDVGSPQVFQTGETFKNAPLIDYQHPHDLIMALGADYQVMAGRVRLAFGADLVGSPTLGPAPYMHRASASENPQAPLAHHYLDSTHITHGVLRTGVGLGRFMLEGSWFRGQEPDEDRLDLDLGPLDSGAVRISWLHGPWSAQLSGAYLTRPERVTPFDAKRVTASVARDAGVGSRGLSWMAAFGQNREAHGNFEAYLLEATWRPSAPNAFYTRFESVAKDILDAGFHPTVFHRHRQSQVTAMTGGYVRDFIQNVRGSLGVGGDITAYGVPANLKESYGSPLSFHVFLRVRGATRPGGHAHVHQ